MRFTLYGLIVVACVLGGLWVTQPNTTIATPATATAPPIGTTPSNNATTPVPGTVGEVTTTRHTATTIRTTVRPATTTSVVEMLNATDDTVDEIDVAGDVAGHVADTDDTGGSGRDLVIDPLASITQTAVEFALAANSDSFDTDPDLRSEYLATLATSDVTAQYPGLSLDERSRFVVRTATVAANPVTVDAGAGTGVDAGAVVDVTVDVTDWADDAEPVANTLTMRITVTNGIVTAAETT